TTTTTTNTEDVVNEKQYSSKAIDAKQAIDTNINELPNKVDNTVQVDDAAVIEQVDLSEKGDLARVSSDSNIEVSTDIIESDLIDTLQENDGESTAHEESIVPNVDIPNVDTCDKEDILKEAIAMDNSNNNIILEDIETHSEKDGNSVETPQQPDDDDVILLSTIHKSQPNAQENEEIVLSEGYKRPEITFSEGVSQKNYKRTSPSKGKDAIRQVRSVVIDSHDTPVNKNDISTVRDIWIPVNNSDDKNFTIALQQLKEDMQKKSEMEARSMNHLLQDMHEFFLENSKDNTPDLEQEATIENQQDGLVLPHSETESAYSINASDNASAHDEYTPTPEPERAWGRRSSNDTPACRTDSPQIASMDKSNGNLSSPKPCVLSSEHVPKVVVRQEGDSEGTSQTLDTSFVQEFDHAKLQQNNEAMILDGLSRSSTSSSNDSVCFSSNGFDTADTNSPVSIAFDGDVEPCHHEDYSLDSNTITNKNSTSDHVAPDGISNQDDSVDISQSNTAQLSDITIISSLTDSSASEPIVVSNAPDHASHLNASDEGITSNALDLYINDTSTDIPLMNNENTLTVSGIPDNLENTEGANETTEMTNSPCLTIRIPAKPIPVKTCCPEFYKFSQGDDSNTTMCSRCSRHLQIFGVEWPNRIGKIKPRYKTKGPKSNKSKATMQKQGIYSNNDPNSESTGFALENTDFNVASGMQHKVSNPAIEQESSGTGLPSNTPENTTSTDPLDSSTLKTRPEKPKVKKPYYYYEIVIEDPNPPPEPILEHPNKPYALRKKGDDGMALQKTSAGSTLAKQQSEQTGKVSKTPAKTPSKRRPPRRSKRQPRPQPSQKPDNASRPKVPKKDKKKSQYYYYEWVLESEETEEVSVIENPNQPYAFRSRKNNKSNSQNEESPSQQPALASSESSRSMETAKDSMSTYNASAHPYLTKNTDITLRTYVTEKVDYPTIQRSEEEIANHPVLSRMEMTKEKQETYADSDASKDSTHEVTRGSDTSKPSSTLDAQKAAKAPIFRITTSKAMTQQPLANSIAAENERDDRQIEGVLKNNSMDRELRKRHVEKPLHEPLSKRHCQNEKEDIAPNTPIQLDVEPYPTARARVQTYRGNPLTSTSSNANNTSAPL
ncbi:hypothetical protein K501DRAFT_288559, partial [Backusella circina FSU 941]